MDCFCVYLGSNILILITLDRFCCIMFALYPIRANRHVGTALWVAWLVAFLAALPQVYLFEIATHPRHDFFTACVTLALSRFKADAATRGLYFRFITANTLLNGFLTHVTPPPTPPNPLSPPQVHDLRRALPRHRLLLQRHLHPDGHQALATLQSATATTTNAPTTSAFRRPPARLRSPLQQRRGSRQRRLVLPFLQRLSLPCRVAWSTFLEKQSLDSDVRVKMWHIGWSCSCRCKRLERVVASLVCRAKEWIAEKKAERRRKSREIR